MGNTTSEPFAVRNRNTNGSFVRQGKRFRFGATASPTLFASFRHRAAEPDPPQLLAGHRVELPAGGQRAGGVCASDRPAGPGDRAAERCAAAGHGQPLAGIRGEIPVPNRDDTATEGAEARKIRLLSLNTSGITYDFEQAKKPGRTGWATQSISNTVLSDLLPGFQPQSHARPLARAGGSRHLQVRPLPPERERELRRIGKYLPVDRVDLRAGRKVIRQPEHPPSR